MHIFIFKIFYLLALVIGEQLVSAAVVREVGALDQGYIRLQVVEGEVRFKEDGSIFSFGKDKVVPYGSKLDITKAVESGSWRLSSINDKNYGLKGKRPLSVHRKTKVNGQSEQKWLKSDYHYEYTFEHTLYLKLPSPLQGGMAYKLHIQTELGTRKQVFAFEYIESLNTSEAIHTNLVGYQPQTFMKAADLYHWMGDGGARDYSGFEGNRVYLYDVVSKKTTQVGEVKLWKKNIKGFDGFDLTKSPVWNVDVKGKTPPGTYRLVVEGVGSSRDFDIKSGVYYSPFRLGVLGYYYMRVGERSEARSPPPRQPRYIPGEDPSNTKVFLTSLHQWHPKWKSIPGDPWDKPHYWKSFRKKGNPVNSQAYGGHADALDWDRHLGHVVSIYDMLLPFILRQGSPGNDHLGIPESGNGIPDLLDEARNEVDFWLRLRDGRGYGSGLTNPTGKNELFQAAPTAMAAWANSANAAMLAECFRLIGHTKLKNLYQRHSEEAYAWASGLEDSMLTKSLGHVKGRDLKMLAAALLFNLTGDGLYEKAIPEYSLATSSKANLAPGKSGHQIWATAAYLKTPHKVGYPKLWQRMKEAVLDSAWKFEASAMNWRPSRRTNRQATGWFRTVHNVQLTMLAHSMTQDLSQKRKLYQALTLEADYGLGRNPLNMIQMTTASTELSGIRSVVSAYTSGGHDGIPGMHPGHTPYMNLFDWRGSMTMSKPSELTKRSYPNTFLDTWPHGEGFFNTRYTYAHSEFTPQQTMAGKLALYGYLVDQL